MGLNNDSFVKIFSEVNSKIDSIAKAYQEEKEFYKNYDDESECLSEHSYLKFEKMLKDWNEVLDYFQSKLDFEEVVKRAKRGFAPDLIPFFNKRYIDFSKSLLSEPYLVIDLKKVYSSPFLKNSNISEAITCIGYDYITPIVDCGIYFKVDNGELCAGIFDLKKANEIVDGYKIMRSECERESFVIREVCDKTLSDNIHMCFATLIKILNLSEVVFR